MKDRLRRLRKALDLTQQAFADKLGVKRNTVGQWECGVNPLTEQTVLSICREFNVNEEWLRDGQGDMFRSLDRQEQIANLTADLFKGEKDSFKERLILALAGLDESEWELLEQIAEKIAKEKD